jgi:putative lipoic acid-binding regulatory protein
MHHSLVALVTGTHARMLTRAALLLMPCQFALLNFGSTREGLEDQLLGTVVHMWRWSLEHMLTC